MFGYCYAMSQAVRLVRQSGGGFEYSIWGRGRIYGPKCCAFCREWHLEMVTHNWPTSIHPSLRPQGYAPRRGDV